MDYADSKKCRLMELWAPKPGFFSLIRSFLSITSISVSACVRVIPLPTLVVTHLFD